ncbi:MAG: hypothetical protein LBF24_02765 [Puniceicoccales bacterium]|nr:hypothetical protein [Puniceicoccales bacterium]
MSFDCQTGGVQQVNPEAILRYAAAIADGTDARDFLRQLITPFNLFGTSKYVSDGRHNLDFLLNVANQDWVANLLLCCRAGNPTTARIASWISYALLLAAPGGAATFTPAPIFRRLAHLLYSAANEVELFRTSGYCLFAREMREIPPAFGGPPTTEQLEVLRTAAELCDRVAERPNFVTDQNAFKAVRQFFSQTSWAMLQSNGFILVNSYSDGTCSLQNPSTGVFFLIKKDAQTGKVFFAPGIGHGNGEEIPDELKKPFNAEQEEDQDTYWKMVGLLRGGTTVGGDGDECGAIPPWVKRRAELLVRFCDLPRKDYSAIVRAANISGMVDPACLQGLEVGLKYVQLSCMQQGIGGEQIVCTGVGLNGMLAQSLALMYDLTSHCFQSDPIGPLIQNKIGLYRIAKNASKAFSYLFIPYNNKQDFVNILLYILFSLQTPGVFGVRVTVPGSGGLRFGYVASAIESIVQLQIALNAGQIVIEP